MIDLSPELIVLIMFGGLLVGVLTGYPLAAVLGVIGIGIAFYLKGWAAPSLIYTRIFMILTNYIILAVPCFVFMGLILQRSGIAERLYDVLYLWLGGIRGGLAFVTVVIGTVLAACVGIIAASVTMLSLVAVPSMVRRGYSKSLAAGATCAGGTLGILIPPSVMLVFYGPMANLSVGKLFMSAFTAGFTLSALYSIYILTYGALRPDTAPPVPLEERQVPLLKKIVMLLSSFVPPVILILTVLGSIFFGIAPPTEAAGVGAFAATILALAYGRLNWRVLKETGLETARVCGMIFLFVAMAVAFVGPFILGGGDEVVANLVLAAPGGKWGSLSVVLFLVFLLGFFIDWLGIVFIIVPIVTPLNAALGFDPIWFAMMIIVTLQTSFMTPPYAGAIFIARGAIPAECGVSMADIIRGVIPFVLLILLSLVLFVFFPPLLTWLPAQMIR
ncbi:MAG: TRAP transporter large permease subunit [Dehalococcoidales bacterium]